MVVSFVCLFVCFEALAAAAAAAAKSLQSCPTLCDPIDGSPPGSPVPGILQARILEWVAISFSNALKGKSLSRPTLRGPMDCSLPGSSVMGFSRQEYWSGVPLPSLMCPLISVHKYLPVYSIYSTSGMSKGRLFKKNFWSMVDLQCCVIFTYTVNLLHIYMYQLKVYIYPLFLDSLSL